MKYKKDDYLICFSDCYPYTELIVISIDNFDDCDLYRVRYLETYLINYWTIEALDSSPYELNIKRMRTLKLNKLNENQMYK
jgi:hypothetical protein